MALTTDSSTNNQQLTANGDVSVNTTTYKYGGGSAYFDGDGDYLEITPTENFNFYNYDFTIECWIYSTNDQNGGAIISTRLGSVYSPFELQIGYPNLNKITLLIYNGSSWYNGGIIYGDTIIPQNEWIHLAWVSQNGNHTVYINGISDPNITNINAPIVDIIPSNVYIGKGGDSAFFGYIDDFQILKGIAKYTENFTPPTAQLPAPYDENGNNVSLLLHMDGTNSSQDFTDSSNNDFTVTVNGDTYTDTSVKKFGASSAYFDGDGDYLQLDTPSNNLIDWHSTDYTLECWVYIVSAPSNTPSSSSPLIGNADISSGIEYWSFGPTNSLSVKFKYWSGQENSLETIPSILNTGQWYHLAFVKNGTRISIYIDGVETVFDTLAVTPEISESYPLAIGSFCNASFNGYIDELRITKGVARYTSNFVPQTAPFPNPTITFPSQGLLAFWKLADLTDSSGNNNTLTNNNNVTFSSGKIGNAANIDESSILSINSIDTINLATSASISFWFNVSTTPSPLSLFLGKEPGFGVGYYNNNILTIFDYAGTEVNTSGNVTSNTWNHIVITTNESNMFVYLNGNLLGTYNNILSNITGLTIGDSQYSWTGQADAVGIWNKTLTQQEVELLYNNGNGIEL